MNQFKSILGAAALACLAAPAALADHIAATTGAGIVQLSELSGIDNITKLSGESVRANKSTANNPITIEGNTFASGIGTHAPSVCVVKLNGAKTFYSIIGVDDESDVRADHGIFDYKVTAYGASEDQSSILASGSLDRQQADHSDTISLENLDAYQYLKLEVISGAQAWADHADWADARFTYEGEVPEIIPQQAMFADAVINLPAAGPNGEEIIPLSSLDLSLCTNGWGTIKKDKSIDGNPITLKNVIYTSGVGLHATAQVVVKLNGAVTAFHAVIGIDDEADGSGQQGNCEYSVYVIKNDGSETSYGQGTIKRTDEKAVNIDITTFYPEDKYLVLEFPQGVGSNGNDHVDIANAYFEYIEQNSTRPGMVAPDVLQLNLIAARTVFSQPGVRFMQKLRCTNPDAQLAVENLPDGLSFNSERNLIEGIVATEGAYKYTVKLSNGEDTKSDDITLTVSSNLQMPTPLMGWLSWNVVEGDISNDVIEKTADSFIDNGFLDAGYNYLIIDDKWHKPGNNTTARTADGYPQFDPAKFPKGMNAAADYVHSKGLKFGIYSDVAANTCAGMFGSHGYYTQDANQYAEWGVDIAKVDYCGAPAEKSVAIDRYTTFNNAFKASGRDIILYICEWGPREPWTWGAEVGAPMWRATYDTRDCWNGKNGGIGVLQSIEGMKDIWMYNGVNRWNDADMLCVAIHNTGKSSSAAHLCATGPGMTQDEYRTQFALWCMWSSPLTMSFDLTKPISDDDLSILTNPEMLALDQDRMGQAAEPLLYDAGNLFVMAKDLENGDVAVSVTNLAATAANYTIDFAKVPGMDPESSYNVRDVEHRVDLDPATDGQLVCTAIPSHATAVYRFSKQTTDGIAEIGATESLGNMTVNVADLSVNVCMGGTEGVSKRVLLSDVKGRVVASATTLGECVTLAAPAPGVYVVNATCAGRSESRKLTL